MNNIFPLTDNPVPIKKGSLENSEGNLIIRMNDVISPMKNVSYRFINFLGKGSYGCVYEAIALRTNEHCAIKVSSNNLASRDSAYRENCVFKFIKRDKMAPTQYSSKYIDYFEYKNHVFIITEMLNISTFQIIGQNNYYGLPLAKIQKIFQDASIFIRYLHGCKILHGDIKPENIMLGFDGNFKMIDFGGSLIHEREFTQNYFQSRYYRAPEVILNLPPTLKVDIWSLGCVAAELAIGLPIFAANNELHVLQLMEMRIGQVPAYMKNASPVCNNFYNKNGEIIKDGMMEADMCKLPLDNIAGIVMHYPHNKDLEEEKMVFIDFLRGMLCIDPKKRFSIEDVCNHPFLHMKFNNNETF